MARDQGRGLMSYRPTGGEEVEKVGEAGFSVSLSDEIEEVLSSGRLFRLPLSSFLPGDDEGADEDEEDFEGGALEGRKERELGEDKLEKGEKELYRRKFLGE